MQVSGVSTRQAALTIPSAQIKREHISHSEFIWVLSLYLQGIHLEIWWS